MPITLTAYLLVDWETDIGWERAEGLGIMSMRGHEEDRIALNNKVTSREVNSIEAGNGQRGGGRETIKIYDTVTPPPPAPSPRRRTWSGRRFPQADRSPGIIPGHLVSAGIYAHIHTHKHTHIASKQEEQVCVRFQVCNILLWVSFVDIFKGKTWCDVKWSW